MPPSKPKPPANPDGRAPAYENTDWGWDGGESNWDPTEGLSDQQRAAAEADYDALLARQRATEDPPRDKWITPLLDWQVRFGCWGIKWFGLLAMGALDS